MRLHGPSRLTIPVYLIAVSVIIIVLMIGWVLREDAIHNRDLKQQQTDTLRFLRTEVCDRLLLRDEIQIGYLTAAYLRYVDDDPEYGAQLLTAIEALKFTKDGCLDELPE
jgi:hypothetical protein